MVMGRLGAEELDVHGPPPSLDQTVVLGSAEGMLIGRCRDEAGCRNRTAERPGRRHDARRAHDARTRRSYNVGTGECKDWMVKGPDGEKTGGARTRWCKD